MIWSSLPMPRDDSSASNWALLTKSRRTGSCRSRFQSSLTAPGMGAASYAVVSSSTSTKTMPPAPRFFSAQSADTSALSRLMSFSLLKIGVQAERAEHEIEPGGAAEQARQCAAVRTPRSEARTQAGGHTAQVDRAPLGEQGAHNNVRYQPGTLRHTEQTGSWEREDHALRFWRSWA